MFKKVNPTKTSLKVNNTVEGESIEAKVRRIMNNKEPIEDGAPLIFTERKDGIQPEYNIRTDRWEIAIDATDEIAKTVAAKRAERAKGADDQTPPTGGKTE